MTSSDFIGVFDSGVGGISVLRALTAELPHENFSYFGDSANAPYGNRNPAEIASLSLHIVESFVSKGAKAVVIACNTATSVAADDLRTRYPELPIIGVEPALKPAVAAMPGGRILVMATPVTLALEKYQSLAESLDAGATIIPVACDGLAARIERGDLHAPDLYELVDTLVGHHRGSVDAVVLGCTHYPFIADVIHSIIGTVPLFDGGDGTARQLRRRLADSHLLASSSTRGEISFASSKKTVDELSLYRRFYELPMED